MTAALPRYRTRLLHLTAVWAYAVTQPALALVDGNPDLMIAHEASRTDLVLFALAVALGFPLLAVTYSWLVSRLSPWPADVLYLVALFVSVLPLAARAVKPLDPALLPTLALVALLAASAVALYTRSRAARLFVGYSIVLPVVAAMAFVHGLPTLTEDAEAASASVEVASPAPVVMIVLDELPVTSLMTGQGEIDATRYPAFGRLAREAVWYPNATTVHEWTSDALPALVTGRVGRTSSLPTSRNHPQNLFSLLGDEYTLVVHESKTQLCSERYCARDDDTTSEVVRGLGHDALRLLVPRILPEALASRLLRVNQDIDLEEHTRLSIDRCDASLEEAAAMSASELLFYCHLLLPHAPWSYLPSGTQYDSTGIDGWLPTEYWGDEPWPVLQGYQRHLLQLGYTDRLLGEMLRRLDESGLYDRALVVVTADHGVSFRAGEGRRVVTGDNFVDVANVPLFVKLPGQRAGRVDERPARTIDVVATIADVLGVRIPWEVDGESLLGPVPARREVVVDQRGGEVARTTLAGMVRDRDALLARQRTRFGEGRDSLFRIGVHRRLLGRAVSSFPRVTASAAVKIQNADDLRQVRLGSEFLPVRIFGEVTSGSIGPETELAVAVNGRIRALTRVFTDGDQKLFRALVPETSLVDGANEVAVFVIQRRGARVALAPLTSG